ncbi:conserved protein of unknown function [Burkholderia multivorans]
MDSQEHFSGPQPETLHDQHVRTWIARQVQLDAVVAELRAQPSYFGDFISIADAFDQVVRHVDISDAEIDDYLPNIGARPSLEELPDLRNIRKWPIRRAFQQVRAASLLLDHLFNDRGIQRPRWIELSSFDAVPVMNDAVALAGRKALEGIGASARDYLSRLDGHAGFSGSRWANDDAARARASVPQRDNSAGERSSELSLHIRLIGFYRTDLVRFLDDLGIRCQIGVHHVDVGSGPPSGDDSTLEFSALLRRPEKKISEGLSTRDLAAALSDTDDCIYKTQRNWLKYLQGSPPTWATDPKQGIRLHAGAQGRRGTSIWHPLKLAIMAVLKYKPTASSTLNGHEFFLAIDERFRKVELLFPWRQDWNAWTDDVYRPMRVDVREASGKPGNKTRR